MIDLAPAGARFALTFDDGPGPSTEPLLDCLAEFGVKATFFVLVSNIEEAAWCDGNVEKARQTVMRALEEGHVVGNHSFSHMSAIEAKRNRHAFEQDVLRAAAVIRSLYRRAGFAQEIEVPFRLPYGPQYRWIRPLWLGPIRKRPDPRARVLAELGWQHTHWTIDSLDWRKDRSPEVLAQRVARHIAECEAQGRRAVVLMHDGVPPPEAADHGHCRPAMLDTVRRLLEICRRERWSSFTAPSLPERRTARRRTLKRCS